MLSAIVIKHAHYSYILTTNWPVNMKSRIRLLDIDLGPPLYEADMLPNELSCSMGINTFTATPLKKSISLCQAYIYFIVFIDLLIYLLIIIFLDICAYHISLKRDFYAEKFDIQYIYLPLKLLSITRDVPAYP